MLAPAAKSFVYTAPTAGTSAAAALLSTLVASLPATGPAAEAAAAALSALAVSEPEKLSAILRGAMRSVMATVKRAHEDAFTVSDNTPVTDSESWGVVGAALLRLTRGDTELCESVRGALDALAVQTAADDLGEVAKEFAEKMTVSAQPVAVAV